MSAEPAGVIANSGFDEYQELTSKGSVRHVLSFFPPPNTRGEIFLDRADIERFPSFIVSKIRTRDGRLRSTN